MPRISRFHRRAQQKSDVPVARAVVLLLDTVCSARRQLELAFLVFFECKNHIYTPTSQCEQNYYICKYQHISIIKISNNK